MPVTARGDTALEANPKALQAARNARIALGTPYVYGGRQFGLGVDCSGLCLIAYRMAGVNIPGDTFTQWDAGWPRVKKGTEIPGDLIFSYWGEGGNGPGHVVMSLGRGMVIAADHAGTVVHIESASIFDSVYVGSRRVLPAVGQSGATSGGGTTAGSTGGGSSAISSIGSALDFLGSWHTWYRFGLVLGGVVAIIGGLYLLVHRGTGGLV